ncbi:MAG: AAA family ATPase [Sulfuriferula sp.]
MQSTLQRVTIKGLHGKKDIDATIDDNTLILVGENGSGKTTFLRILYHVLSGRWLSLIQYRFDSIEMIISGTKYEIAREELSRGFEKIDRRFLAELPPTARRRLMELFREGESDRISIELERIQARYGIPTEIVMRQLNLFEDQPRGLGKEIQEKIRQIQRAIDAQILYLPTYRRIERELSSIFEGFDQDDIRRNRYRIHARETESSYIELVEFGMQDVERAIKMALEGIKDFARESLNNLTLKYLGAVVNREYLDVGMSEIANTPEETIRSVLNRIHESILTRIHKEHLFNVINSARSNSAPDEHTKIICHYFLKLLSFQKALETKEKNMSDFCALCSAYIVDKQFVYDNATFGFDIRPLQSSEDTPGIDLSDLSSGEKQIVSLFSHLYLSGKNRFLVLIDEPELSLSVPWQRRFLSDIRKGGFCAGLIAVTHSPFIYDNELKTYARSLGEFVTVGEL